MTQDATERPTNTGDEPSLASWMRAARNAAKTKTQQNRGGLQIPAHSLKRDAEDALGQLEMLRITRRHKMKERVDGG